jgi:hypothetical protein
MKLRHLVCTAAMAAGGLLAALVLLGVALVSLRYGNP